MVLPTGVVAWPALWDFSHSRRLIDAALLSASRFLDELVVTGPGLYRREPVAAAPGAATGTRTGARR